MILVCEPICWGLEHVPVNAGVLAIIRIAFPHETISVFGEESHLDLVREQLGGEMGKSIEWRNVGLPPRNSKFKDLLLPDFKLASYVLNEISKEGDGHLLFTSGRPSLLWAVKLLLGSRHRGKKVQIILHGGTATITGWRSRNPLIRIQDYRTAFRIPGNRNIQYIVLEETIKERLLDEIPLLVGHVGVLDHPIPINEGCEKLAEFKPPFQFGFLGLATEQKGFFKFLEVASSVKRKYPELSEFHAIGKLHGNYKNLSIPEMKWLSTQPTEESLRRSDFIKAATKLHFVCLFFQGKIYELSASGVLLDSIVWEKPIIGTGFPMLRNLRERFGDMGYLCGNGELNATVESIIRDSNPVRYRHQVDVMRQIKESRTPQALAPQYYELCRELERL